MHMFADVAVTEVIKESDSYFKVRDASGKVWNLPCLFCQGYEDRDAPSTGVLAVAPVAPTVAVHMAHNATQLTDQVTICTNGDEEVAAELKPLVSSLVASKFNVETRQIKRLIGNGLRDSITVEFVDGSSKEEKFLVHNPRASPRGPFVAQLGLATTPLGDIRAEAPFWQTSVPGVFAVGDCSTPYKVVPSAITSGCNAAVAASAEIQAAKFNRALGP
ncbi:hypothetical protein DL768_008955 [Monosporascus sp. mg162]|nr:hypothetical protein DL768_008955 [Monosporascus sp. mg162]